MKTLLSVLIILSIMSTGVFGQLTPQQKLTYQQKVNTYSASEHSGRVLAGVGSFLGVGGIALTLSVDDIAARTAGITLASCGAAMAITGLIISQNSGRKAEEYQQKLNLGMIYNDECKGLMLTYKF